MSDSFGIHLETTYLHVMAVVADHYLVDFAEKHLDRLDRCVGQPASRCRDTRQFPNSLTSGTAACGVFIRIAKPDFKTPSADMSANVRDAAERFNHVTDRIPVETGGCVAQRCVGHAKGSRTLIQMYRGPDGIAAASPPDRRIAGPGLRRTQRLRR